MRAPLRALRSPARADEHTSELQSHRDLHSFPTRRSSDLDVAAAVLEVQGVSPPLAAVAEDGDAGALESSPVDVFLRIQPHLTTPRGLAAVCARIKNPAAASKPVRGLGLLLRSCLGSCIRRSRVPRTAHS